MEYQIKMVIDLSETVYDYIRRGDTNRVEYLIAKNFNFSIFFNARHGPGNNRDKALYLKKKFAEFLIDNYTNFQTKEFELNREMFELLHSHNFNTKIGSFLDTLDILLNKELNFDPKHSIKLQLIKSAIEKKNHRLFDFFLESDIAAYFKDGQEETPLHFVVNIGNIATTQTFIEKGVNINVTDHFGLTPLHIAVRKNDFEIVKLLIINGANINCKTLEKKTPLHLAAANKSVNMIKLLLDYGANVNISSEGEITPLHIAVESGNREVVTLLVKHGANVNATGNKDETPLNIAVANEHAKISEFLISKGAIVNHGSNDDMLLHMAIFNKNEELVELLLANNADVTVKFKGTTALHLTITCKCIKFIELLLEKGADINEQNADGNTAFHLAVEHENEFAIKVLLKYKPNIDIKNNAGKTPLYIALAKGSLDIITQLLNLKPNREVNSEALRFAVKGTKRIRVQIVALLRAHGYSISFLKTDQPFETYDFIRQCVTNGHVDLVEDLLKHGIDPNIAPPQIELMKPSFYFTSLLHIATDNNHSRIAELLVANNCDLNIRDCYYNTPLHYAVKFGNKEITKLLLDNKARVDGEVQELFFLAMMRGEHGVIEEFLKHYRHSVNYEDDLGTTALHFAAWNGNLETVQLLFEKGARCIGVDADMQLSPSMADYVRRTYGSCALNEFRNEMVTTPLHIAAQKNYSDIAEVLLNRGSDVNWRDGAGRTPLQIAAFFGQVDVIDVLMEYGADFDATDKLGRTCLEYAHDYRDILYNRFSIEGLSILYKMPRERARDVPCDAAYPSLVSYTVLRNLTKKTEQPTLPPDGMEIYEKCVEEITLMMETTVFCKVTLYDVLMQDVNTLVDYLNNEQFLNFFSAQTANEEFDESFAMYSRILKNKIKRAKERRILLNEAYDFFANCLRLPDLVSEKITRFLSNKDLRRLKQTCEPSSIQLGVKCNTT